MNAEWRRWRSGEWGKFGDCGVLTEVWSKRMKENLFYAKDFFKYNLPVVVERMVQKSEDFLPPGTLNRREFWKIFFIISGKGCLEINGQKFNFHPSFFCLNHPNDLTNFRIEEPIELYNILFKINCISSDFQKIYDLNHFFSIFKKNFNPTNSPIHTIIHIFNSPRDINRKVKEMHKEFMHPDANSGEMLRFMLLELLITASRHSSKLYHKKYRNEVVNLVNQYLQTHLQEPCKTSSIAEELGISRSWLLELYRRYNGISIGEKLLRMRIDKAIDLLQNTTYPISRICFASGFSDLSNFHKKFQQATGLSPLKYRQKFKNNP